MCGAIMNNVKTDYIIYEEVYSPSNRIYPKEKMYFICVRYPEIENVK